MQIAGFGRRFLSGILDTLLFLFVFSVAFIASDILISNLWDIVFPGAGGGRNYQSGAEGLVTAMYIGSYFIPMVVIFYSLPGLFWGKSPGQALMGLKVRARNGEPAGFRARLGRHLITHGWAWLLLLGMIISDNLATAYAGVDWTQDIIIKAIVSLGLIGAACVCITILQALFALGRKKTSLWDGLTKTWPYRIKS